MVLRLDSLRNFFRNKVAKLNLRVVSGQAKSGPPLSAVLAPFGINVADFCKEFNALSTDLTTDEVEFDVCLYINLKTKKFKIIIKGVSLSYLISSLLEINKESLTMLNLYKLFLIQQYFFNDATKKLGNLHLKNLLASIDSMHLRDSINVKK